MHKENVRGIYVAFIVNSRERKIEIKKSEDSSYFSWIVARSFILTPNLSSTMSLRLLFYSRDEKDIISQLSIFSLDPRM